MNVLMLARPNLLENPGGDTTQILKTKEHLAKLGIRAELALELSEEAPAQIADYDLIHVFADTNRQSCVYSCIQAAVSKDKPVVLSTIYWKWPEQEEYQARRDAFGLLRGALPYIAKQWATRSSAATTLLEQFYSAKARLRGQPTKPVRGHWQLKRQMSTDAMFGAAARSADVLLPNSEAEMRLIEELHQVDTPYVVVPNAADPLFVGARPDWFRREYGAQDFVMCAGCVCLRKGQLGLLKALHGTGLRVVIVGRATGAYADRCRRVAPPDALWVPYLPPERLASAYAAARVHVLASYYETPGLANLEAALADCVIVSTTRGSTHEYFQDDVFYCEPDDIASIRSAVLAAWQAQPSPCLRERILKHYTWQAAAQATLRGYELAMARYVPSRSQEAAIC